MSPENQDLESYFPGASEMARLARTVDWSRTPIGPVGTWSQSLRMMVRFLLANRFPCLLWWGSEFVQIYNDSYKPIPGAKHPRSLGQAAKECWPEIWHIIGPLVETPFTGGPATWMDDLFLEVNRYGYCEETHFTVAYSPVPDESVPSKIGGVLATVHEITEKVVGERRVHVLRDLGARAGEAKTIEQACRMAAETLEKHSRDVPFAALYVLDSDRRSVSLVASAGCRGGTPDFPSRIGLDGESTREVWPLRQALLSETAQVVDRLSHRLTSVPPGPWSDPPGTAVVLPIRSNIAHQPVGVLIAGTSSRLKFDANYGSFYDLIASQVSTAIANACAYEEEKKRAEALAEIDRAKTAFFSNVSHEFRTPLTLLLGPVEEAVASAQDADQRARLELVHRNALRLQKLVNTLLDFSRIEAGRIEARYVATDLAHLTRELASVFRSAVEKAGMELIVDCSPLSEPIFVDRDMYEKVVFNLLSNAFKFTLEGQIEVTLRESRDAVDLRVRDTGAGIAENELPRVFERFHRVPGVQARTQEGTGIGLALVRELAKLHFGSVSVESVPGKGSTFTVRLPKGKRHLPPEKIGGESTLASTALAGAHYVEEAQRWSPQRAAGPTASRSPASGSPTNLAPDGRRQRIVWADDNADMRDYVRELLLPFYDVEAVSNGEAALEAVKREIPELVLSDVMMPLADGFQLLRALRADESTRTVPVILLSARAGEEARIEGMQAGADDYLVKPFNARELLARVEGHIKLARVRRETEAVLRERERQIARDLASMTRLHQLSTKLLKSSDFSSLLHDVLDAAIEITQADMGNIQLLHDGELKIVAQRGFHAPFLEYFESVREGSAACGTAMKRARRVVVEDVASDPIFTGSPARQVLLAANARAVQSTPLTDRSGRLLGMFSTHYHAPRKPAERDLRLVDLLARQAADLIERGYAEKHLRLRTAQFETLLNQAPLGVYLVDADFRIREVNPVARAAFGDIPDLVGRDFDEIIHVLWTKEFADEIVRIFRRTLATGEPHVMPEQIERRLDRGVTEYYEWRIDRIPLPDGRFGVVCYFRDISTYVLARQAIQASERELKEVNNRKDDFLAMLAHELRNPLAPIQGAAQVLKLPGPSEQNVAWSIDVIERQVAHLSALIDDLLDVSRITRGKIELKKEVIELSGAIASAVEANRALIDSKQQRLSVDLVPVVLSADGTRVTQIVSNLLNNASKYTPERGSLSITSRLEDGMAVVKVKDTGPGIPDTLLPHVFDLFVQGERSLDRTQGGLGIGLTIVKSLVELHGGLARIETEEGKGTTFIVSLPALREPAPLKSTKPEHRRGASRSPKKVLVVDDHVDGAETITLLLRALGHEVRSAHDGPSALEVSKSFAPDVVLLDIGLPRMDGYEVARRLRRISGREHLVLVAMTGYGQEEDRRQAYEAGFDLHLTKPISFEAVETLLERWDGGVGRS